MAKRYTKEELSAPPFRLKREIMWPILRKKGYDVPRLLWNMNNVGFHICRSVLATYGKTRHSMPMQREIDWIENLCELPRGSLIEPDPYGFPMRTRKRELF
jgi:hypothetical protein